MVPDQEPCVRDFTTRCVAKYCKTVQHTAWGLHRESPLPIPDAVTHCNSLQHTATHCNTLQHTTTHCNTLCWVHKDGGLRPGGKISILAVCCSVLQCVAVCCSVLQCVAVCWLSLSIYLGSTHSTMQHTAVSTRGHITQSHTHTHTHTHIPPPTLTLFVNII